MITRCQEIIRELEAKGDIQAAVLDAALLIEARMTFLVDEVWVVSIPEEVQLARLMARNSFTRDQALARLHSQMLLKDKLLYADKVIDNTGTVEQTREIVFHLWQELLHKIALRDKPEGIQ